MATVDRSYKNVEPIRDILEVLRLLILDSKHVNCYFRNHTGEQPYVMVEYWNRNDFYSVDPDVVQELKNKGFVAPEKCNCRHIEHVDHTELHITELGCQELQK